MLNTRISPLFRLTAAGLTLSLAGLTFSPLARAQASADAGTETTPKPPDKKTRDAARKAYSKAEKDFAKGDFIAAESGFQQANTLIPSPHAQYWIAKSLEAQDGKTQEAAQAYEQFLANPEAGRAGQDKLTDATARLQDLKAKLVARIDLTTVPAGATILVDGTPEPTGTPVSLKLQPGKHQLTITAPDYESKEVTIEVRAGDHLEHKVELVAKPPPPPAPAPVPPPPPPPVLEEPLPPMEKRSLVPAYVTLGVAGAGAIVGTIFGLKALSAKSDFDDKPTTDSADDTERNALIADMAFGVAITLGVTGLVLLTSGDESESQPLARSVPPRLKLELDAHASPKGGGAAARLRF